MTSEQAKPESFAAFKYSFAYGLRSDMNFKFLKGLDDQDVSRFSRSCCGSCVTRSTTAASNGWLPTS